MNLDKNMTHLSMKTLYMLAYQWTLDKESILPHDEITRQVSVITDYLDFVWKHKQQKGPGKQSLHAQKQSNFTIEN